MTGKQTRLICRIAACAAVASSGAGTVQAAPTTINFVDASGKPVTWGTNTLDYPGLAKFDSTITIDTGDATLNLGGLYLLGMRNGARAALTPGMTLDKGTLTIDASEITNSLRQTAGLAWSGGKLYAAEWHHDGIADNLVWVFDDAGKLIERIPTVHRPAAIAVVGDALFVAGDQAVAKFDIATKKQLFAVPLTYAASIHEIAALSGRLYIGDSADGCVVVLNADTGTEVSRITGAPDNTLVSKSPSLSGIGVAATPTGAFVVSDSQAIREFRPDGTFVRKLVDVKNGSYVAVDATGRIALAVPYSSMFVSDVWIYDKDGKPLTRLLHTGWGRAGSFANIAWNYLAGLTGKILAPGGLAFDPNGNLYVSDFNDYVKSEAAYRGFGDHITTDGGIVKLSPTNDILARWGSRYSDGAVIRSRLAERASRQPLFRTAAALKGGKSLYTYVLGDSLTQVGGDWNGGATKTSLNWTHRFADLMAQTTPGLKSTVNPAGIGGNLAFDGLSRSGMPDPYPQPELYLIEFGTNDQMFEPASRYAEALRQLVRQLQVQTDSDIVILSPHMLDGDNAKKIEPPQDYVDAAIAVGKETGVPVINMEEGMKAKLAGRAWPTLYLDRGTPFDPHLNDAGHEAWAECVRDGIIAELKREATAP